MTYMMYDYILLMAGPTLFVVLSIISEIFESRD